MSLHPTNVKCVGCGIIFEPVITTNLENMERKIQCHICNRTYIYDYKKEQWIGNWDRKTVLQVNPNAEKTQSNTSQCEYAMQSQRIDKKPLCYLYAFGNGIPCGEKKFEECTIRYYALKRNQQRPPKA